MNKNCPICNKPCHTSDPHEFWQGKRTHKACLDQAHKEWDAMENNAQKKSIPELIETLKNHGIITIKKHKH